MTDILTRERIVEVATEYFLKHGFSKVTTDELATELGMSKKTLYKNFATKEDILREAVQMVMHDWNVRTGGFLRDPAMSVIAKLRQLMDEVAKQYSRMGRTFVEDLRRNAPSIWKEINAWRDKYILTEFRRFYREGVEQQVFRSDIPDHLAVLIYASAVQQMLNPDRLAELPYTAGEIADAVCRIVYEGVLTDNGRAAYRASIAGAAAPVAR